MPRNHQPKRNNPYWMEHNLRMQVLYLIKRYQDLIDQRNNAMYGSPAPPDGMPKGSGITGDPTQCKALVLAALSSQIEAIDQTIVELRGIYDSTCGSGLFDPYKAFKSYENFCYYRSDPNKDIAPSKITWKRYRSEFIYKVAKKLNYL